MELSRLLVLSLGGCKSSCCGDTSWYRSYTRSKVTDRLWNLLKEVLVRELTALEAKMDLLLNADAKRTDGSGVDPTTKERLVHPRWTNTIPTEGGPSQSDAVISRKQQLEYEGSVGHGEVKINQGNTSKYCLCMDTAERDFIVLDD
ncbi:uncharacterized protein BX664DRAFT_389645 [Halteromyces radiatus]|uniref:uncharacterized protein n=1 Tax=Halteromyces radiatus TaxID=101107 RepID=UPI00221E5AC3|nr:uncharacterized protein BX664DRAFT_389645 [Halteromyces radiatus]KAI8076313.1 hypothetical protein BX664DRAFT_389645 [Halteromyces radiatus]